MSFASKLALAAPLALATLSAPALADIVISDAYARGALRNGAAFMSIENTGPEGDHLIDARSDIAARVELHTHIDAGNGVMQMRHVPDGWVIPAGETHMLMRGGDHVMFMGLAAPFTDGEMVTVTLVFEKAGEITIEVPVDSTRDPMGQGAEGMGAMKHGDH